MALDGSLSLLAVGAAQFAGTLISPFAVLGVLAVGALLRWRAAAIRLSAILIAVGLTIPAAMEAAAFWEIAVRLTGAVLGALLIAEVLITLIIPLVRRKLRDSQRRSRPSPARPVPVTVNQSHPRVGRNDPCPCGSGKKFKKCCLNR